MVSFETDQIPCELREYPPNPDNEHRPTIWVMTTGVDRLTLFAIDAEQTECKRLGNYPTIKAANDAARRLTLGKKFKGWSRMCMVRMDRDFLRKSKGGIVYVGNNPAGFAKYFSGGAG